MTNSKIRFAQIGGKRRPIGKLLEHHADTLPRAERAGGGATMTFDVSPDDETRLVEVDAKRDALDSALAAAKVTARARS